MVIFSCAVQWRGNVKRSLTENYGDIYSRVMETATRQLIGSVQKFVNQWSWNAFNVEEDVLRRGGSRDAVMGLPELATNVWMLPTVRRWIILLEERWFWTHVEDVLGSVNDGYVGQVLNDGQVHKLVVTKKRYESYE